MRRHTSTYAGTRARARTRANTPHTDKSKTGLILVPRISYFHASIKNKKKLRRSSHSFHTNEPRLFDAEHAGLCTVGKSSRLDTSA